MPSKKGLHRIKNQFSWLIRELSCMLHFKVPSTFLRYKTTLVALLFGKKYLSKSRSSQKKIIQKVLVIEKTI